MEGIKPSEKHIKVIRPTPILFLLAYLRHLNIFYIWENKMWVVIQPVIEKSKQVLHAKSIMAYLK